MSLDALGLQFCTDKASSDHGYLDFYERYFAALRHMPIKLLEIGVLRGNSLALWEAYFPNALIVGADIDIETSAFARERVAIEIIDQSNIEHLIALGVKHGPFDIDIDDGSHMWEHQTTTLRTMFPFVEYGGFYVVEDLHTSFGMLAPSFRGVASFSCADYLKRLVDLRVADSQIDLDLEEDPFLRTYGRLMHTINFSRRACLIEKSLVRGVQITTGPFVAVGHDPSVVPLTLSAHVAFQGDRTSPVGWIRSKDDKTMLGFSIEPVSTADCGLLYKARLRDGTWTDWVPPGTFVGGRGIGLDLTGFAVRLDPRSAGSYRVQAIGQFCDVLEPISADSGEECITPRGLARLCGMQIILRSS